MANEVQGSPALASQAPGQPRQGCKPSVFVFNPFTEGNIARGNAYSATKHQAKLAEDLANLPQFLCEPGDVVLLAKRPAEGFLAFLRQAGFAVPEFVELSGGRIDSADSLCQRQFASLRPWAWGPDSVNLLEPLFAQVVGEARTAAQYFNGDIARLYSKAWSAGFLRKVLACFRGGHQGSPLGAVAQRNAGPSAVETWLCSEREAGIVAGSLEDALGAIAVIRTRGHHRVVVKAAYGFAGQNAIRLWEPEILPAQRQWLSRALRDGQQLVVEPWLERELDFSVQLEMGTRGLKLCGYTGLLNDGKGQFQANWAEPNYAQHLPARVAALFCAQADISGHFERLYRAIFPLLETELQHVGFVGPVSLDAFVYRTPQGDCRLKPVVEINPRYTMGRLTVELMKHACRGSCGLFRLVTRGQARTEGFADLSGYVAALGERARLCLEGGPLLKVRRGALCLNDPAQARVCLATFEVGPAPHLPVSLSCDENPRSRQSCNDLS